MKPFRPSMFDSAVADITRWCAEGLSLRAVARRLVSENKVGDVVSGQALHYFCVTRGIGSRRGRKEPLKDSRFCDECGGQKPLEDFSTHSSRSQELKTTCKGCLRKIREFSIVEEVRKYVALAKKKPCSDCSNTYCPQAMDFDHRDPSQKDFSLSRADDYILSRVRLEMEKCDLVCATCHRIREARRRAGLPATLPPPEYHI